MRKLSAERRASILSALTEGVGINATARMCGVSKLTVLRLLRDAGAFCEEFHDRTVRNIASKRVEADELWSYCGCKEKTRKQGSEGFGDAWVWVAMDSDTKLVLSWFVGKRTASMAEQLMYDAAKRVVGEPMVTTDALKTYEFAIRQAFKDRASHAVINKTFAPVIGEAGRYSPPQCTSCTKTAAFGSPDLNRATTSYVERQNLSARLFSRRLTRLTAGWSKRIENHAAAMALHYVAFNFIKKHTTLKTTPAVAAGIASAPMTTLDLVRLIEAAEAEKGGRLTEYQPAVANGAK